MLMKTTQCVAFCVALSAVNLAQADDAHKACEHINAKVMRSLPSFLQNDTIGCDALPPNKSQNINQLCITVAHQQFGIPSCAVTYYEDKPADTVIQCSSTEQPQELFKYVLCKKNSHYVWTILENNTRYNLNKKINQPT